MPRRSSSLAPGRVKGVPAASATVGDLYREYLADRAAGIPQKETDKAVRLPDERNAAKDQRRDIYAMRGNQTPAYPMRNGTSRTRSTTPWTTRTPAMTT